MNIIKASLSDMKFYILKKIQILSLAFIVISFFCNSVYAVDIEKWKQFRVSFTNTTWTGNPFDLDFTSTFTHTSNGRQMIQFGFYAGNNTWKVYFMPDEVGEWTYITNSSDAELNGLTGSFNGVSSNLRGKLINLTVA